MKTLQLFNILSTYSLFFLNEHGQITSANKAAFSLFQLNEYDHLPQNIFSNLVQTKNYVGDDWFAVSEKLSLFLHYEISENPNEKGFILLAFDQTKQKHQLQIVANTLQDRLEAILKAAPLTIWNINKEGVFHFYEGRGLASHPEPHRDLVGLNIFDTAKSFPKIIEAVQQALAGKPSVGLSEAAARYYKTDVTPQFDDKNNIIGAVGVTIDVTKETHQTFEQKKWNEIFEHAPWGIAIGTADHVFTRVNPAFVKMHGGTINDWINQPVSKMYVATAQIEFEERRKKLFLQNSLKFESDHKRLDETTFPVMNEISLIRDDAEKPLYIVGNYFDLTLVKKADQAIQEEQAKLQKLISANVIGVVFWDETGVIDANEAFLNMLGYTKEDLKNGLINESSVVPPEFYELNQRRRDEYKKTGSIQPFEMEHFHKDGSRVPVLIGTTKISETSNTGMSWILDLTQQKKMQNEARLAEIREKSALEASKLKSNFLANMSHEIRTPINGVVGMTHLLKDTSLNAEQKDICDHIARSAESLMSVINDILDFSKVEAGKIEIEKVSFNLNQVVSETLAAMNFAAQKKSVALVLEYQDPINQNIITDPGRLRQILNNLIGNAVKFTLTGSVTVKVKLTQINEKAEVFIEIIDTGIGISKETQAKLFEPFVQADSSTNRRFGGSGLGLSICKGLVDILGGQIGVRSAVGQGSTFWFSIVVDLAKPSEKDPSLNDLQFTTQTQFKNSYILVAEDNQINQVVAVKMLQKMGYKPQAVANGVEVLKALRERKFDLILMDCQMPELDGYETTRLLRKIDDPTFQVLPVIAMTANAVAGDKEKCIEAGMNDYIAKPVEPHVLFNVVEKWLAKSTTYK